MITSTYRGPISFEFVLPGDVPEVWFFPVEHTLGYDTPEKWTRTTTRLEGGHLTSIFQATIDVLEVVDGFIPAVPEAGWETAHLRHTPHEFSRVPLGHLALSPEYTPEWDGAAQVRILRTPLNLPRSPVHRINDEAQYSSHVINLVVPTYADYAVNYGYDLIEVARRFYEYFGDDYDTLGVIPHAIGKNASLAYHDTVQNHIHGLGISIVDRSRSYGSLGRLRSVHFYPFGVENYVVIHETAHQWWEFWDWEGVAGVENVDGSHGPNYTIPAIGRRQVGQRIVGRPGGGYGWEWVPRRDSIPYLKNPVTLYKMGYIGPEDVPEITVFQTEDLDAPRTVHINDFIAAHGSRRGPVEGESWRMAVVVVTQNRLLSRDMMSAYNFMAARVAALPGFRHRPSFFEATDGHMRLQTHVRPKTGPQLEPPMPVDVMPFLPIDAAEIPGIRFDSPLTTRILVGAELVVDGEITDESVLGGADGTRICGHWTGGDVYVQKETCGELSRGGRFHLEWDAFAAAQAGLYSLLLSGFRELPVEVEGGFWVTVGSDRPTTVSAGQDRLVAGQRLYAGQFIRARRAACRLEFRPDGDLIAYADGLPYWNAGSGSLAAGGGFAAMQRDGNFVVFDARGRARWSTRSGGNPGARVAIQSDCNVVVRAPGGEPLWASGRP